MNPAGPDGFSNPIYWVGVLLWIAGWVGNVGKFSSIRVDFLSLSRLVFAHRQLNSSFLNLNIDSYSPILCSLPCSPRRDPPFSPSSLAPPLLLLFPQRLFQEIQTIFLPQLHHDTLRQPLPTFPNLLRPSRRAVQIRFVRSLSLHFLLLLSDAFCSFSC